VRECDNRRFRPDELLAVRRGRLGQTADGKADQQ
jgi:hypothetical protein